MKRGDGGGRETQKEKTGEEAAQQGTVLVCGNHHTHVGKTRQDMGMGGHTKGKKDVGHTRGKGREKTRRGSPKDTHHTRKREKGKKTMIIIRQSRALHRVHLFNQSLGLVMPGMTRKGRDRRGRRKREEREKERKEEKKGDRKGRKKERKKGSKDRKGRGKRE